jgi:hypothetical protein
MILFLNMQYCYAKSRTSISLVRGEGGRTVPCLTKKMLRLHMKMFVDEVFSIEVGVLFWRIHYQNVIKI